MSWNWLQAEIAPADRLIRPIVGAGGLTRAQARAEIQSTLDRLATDLAPEVAVIAEQWRRDAVRDDTVYWQVFTWAVYEYPDDGDPRRAAHAWMTDFARTIRSTGFEVNVARLPD